MSYIYKEPKQAEGVWKDNEGNQWKYGTMTGQLVGDTRIDQKVRKYTYIIDTDKKLPIEPPRKRIGIFEKVIGYLPCYADEEESCVRIIGLSMKKINIAFAIGGLACVSILVLMLSFIR